MKCCKCKKGDDLRLYKHDDKVFCWNCMKEYILLDFDYFLEIYNDVPIFEDAE